MRAVAAGLALTVLAGCADTSARTEARYLARQAAVDPPALWLAQSIDPQGRVEVAVLVCADTTLRQGFTRATVQAGEAFCAPHRDAVIRPDLYAVRCDLGGRGYGLTVSLRGDPEQAFETRFALQPLAAAGGGASQTVRYRRIGSCPAGWGIGDQARPDAPKGRNALAG
ncbi:hypothetical protein [Phenylobacterium sp.]|uniref:hypothetical protein n=1 Tax=Phenylobacterium sp. TaxID=1871053 RepID=UPI00398381BF